MLLLRPPLMAAQYRYPLPVQRQLSNGKIFPTRTRSHKLLFLFFSLLNIHSFIHSFIGLISIIEKITACGRTAEVDDDGDNALIVVLLSKETSRATNRRKEKQHKWYDDCCYYSYCWTKCDDNKSSRRRTSPYVAVVGFVPFVLHTASVFRPIINNNSSTLKYRALVARHLLTAKW